MGEQERLVGMPEEEDSDMKIVEADAQPVPAPDDGELAAREWEEQKENGNIEKAYALGKKLSELIFQTDEVLSRVAPASFAANPVIQSNAQVLFAFMVDIVLEHSCPNSVTAHTALNYFHEKIKERSQESYDAIVQSGTFSLYLLCIRDEKMACSCIGTAFADSCDMESDEQVVRIGDLLYEEFFAICKKELEQAKFSV